MYFVQFNYTILSLWGHAHLIHPSFKILHSSERMASFAKPNSRPPILSNAPNQDNQILFCFSNIFLYHRTIVQHNLTAIPIGLSYRFLSLAEARRDIGKIGSVIEHSKTIYFLFCQPTVKE